MFSVLFFGLKFPKTSIWISCPSYVNIFDFPKLFLVFDILDSYSKPCRPHSFWFCPRYLWTSLATRINWLRLTSLGIRHVRSAISRVVSFSVRSAQLCNLHWMSVPTCSIVFRKLVGRGLVPLFFLLVSASLIRFSSASVLDFSLSVFRSSIKMNSAFLITSSVAFLSCIILSITWFICIN